MTLKMCKNEGKSVLRKPLVLIPHWLQWWGQWRCFQRTEAHAWLYVFFSQWCWWLLLPLLSLSARRSRAVLVFQGRESRVDFLEHSSSRHWFLCRAAEEVVFFVTGIKACICSALVVDREFNRSEEESSPMAVLSGCSFPPPGSTAQIELFVTKDAVIP